VAADCTAMPMRGLLLIDAVDVTQMANRSKARVQCQRDDATTIATPLQSRAARCDVRPWNLRRRAAHSKHVHMLSPQ